MKIITAESQHLKDLVPLFDAYRIFYKQSSDLESAREFLEERMRKNESVVFIAYDDSGTPLGFTQLYPMFSSVSMQRTFVLNDLYVDKNARGKGIGEALLKHAKGYAIQNKAKGLTLETATDNPAQALYERLGWIKDSDVFHYTWKS